MVSAVGVRRHQLHGQLDLRNLRRDRLMDRRLLLSAMAESLGLEGNRRRLRAGESAGVKFLRARKSEPM